MRGAAACRTRPGPPTRSGRGGRPQGLVTCAKTGRRHFYAQTRDKSWENRQQMSDEGAKLGLMTSSATRRKQRRQMQRERFEEIRDDWRDEQFGLSIRGYKPGQAWRGQFRWSIDRDSYLALMALERARQALDGLEMQLVEEVRTDGASWDDVGFALGLTGEAVRKKYQRRQSTG